MTEANSYGGFILVKLFVVVVSISRGRTWQDLLVHGCLHPNGCSARALRSPRRVFCWEDLPTNRVRFSLPVHSLPKHRV